MTPLAQKIELLNDEPLKVLPELLALSGEDAQMLRRTAYDVKKANIGQTVYFRGIIELSNICDKNCFYCGIRHDNQEVKRYLLSHEEVMNAAQFAFEANYGSVVLQAGEICTPNFIDYVEQLLLDIRQKFDGKLGVTLSLGEQSAETYQRWFNAGAHRYLLRIETSVPEHYQRLHPQDGHHIFEERKAALQRLRDGGWQTGSGILIGFPQQTYDDLAADLMFLKNMDVDMVGMGPFLPHHQTPMAEFPHYDPALQLQKGLNAIACMRLLMPRINIASSTALQALDARGREYGILAGANIIMPNITDTRYRESYQLYDGKPALNENAEDSRLALEQSIARTGESIGYGKWGDSQYFYEAHAPNKK